MTGKRATLLLFVVAAIAACGGRCPTGQREQPYDCRTEVLPATVAPDGVSIGSGLSLRTSCEHRCVLEGAR